MNNTIEVKRFTLDEIDALDAMLPIDAAAWMMTDHSNLLYKACKHYLRWHPEAWQQLANAERSYTNTSN